MTAREEVDQMSKTQTQENVRNLGARARAAMQQRDNLARENEELKKENAALKAQLEGKQEPKAAE